MSKRRRLTEYGTGDVECQFGQGNCSVDHTSRLPWRPHVPHARFLADRPGRSPGHRCGRSASLADPVVDPAQIGPHQYFYGLGSDVNVATHLLTDVYEQKIEAAVVISNDSDLALPIKHARARVPVGTVHPGTNYPAGALSGSPDEGVGRHWWRQLAKPDYLAHQLPDPAGRYRRPAGW